MPPSVRGRVWPTDHRPPGRLRPVVGKGVGGLVGRGVVLWEVLSSRRLELRYEDTPGYLSLVVVSMRRDWILVSVIKQIRLIGEGLHACGRSSKFIKKNLYDKKLPGTSPCGRVLDKVVKFYIMWWKLPTGVTLKSLILKMSTTEPKILLKWWTYLIFVIFLHWKFYTQKCVNSRQNSVNHRIRSKFHISSKITHFV